MFEFLKLKLIKKTFWNDNHLCISVQKYLISNGAESTYNLGPDRLGPERPETKITTDIIRVRGYVAMFICKDLQT